MHIPSSTYRLQFRNGMTFHDAIDLIPHLKSLGVSDLYASPIFTATQGSTHGYDVVDANAIDPSLGGRQGFEDMCDALRQAELGLILDIVPNHMAASLENAWWRDVLHKGRDSAYAGYFDIDWSRQITLPVLGKSLDDALANGELQLVRNDSDGSFGVSYFDTHFPLNDESVTGISQTIRQDPAQLQAFTNDTDLLKSLLARQHWTLRHWKDASRNLSYRRFFEVTGLVGMRVEDEQVFHETHRLILELVETGKVQGLRIDHIDGLADPKTYLARLRQAIGPDVYLVVEKILGPDEELPASWPVSGTTGYEFIAALCEVFTAPEGLNQLGREYENVDAKNADFQAGLRRAKMLMVERNFEGEVSRLVEIAGTFAPHLDPQDIRLALQELLIAFPVYRTYGYRGGLSGQDKAILATVLRNAGDHVPNQEALKVIAQTLHGHIDGEAAFEFRARFQQLSGPVMAKAMEDTLFYRYNRLIAANEVGGDANTEGGGVAHFHKAMLARSRSQPHGLSATSTHDTKRGEDARARLYTLSEGADTWTAGVKRWRDMNRDALTLLPDGPTPEPNTAWMLYQSLAGLWLEDAGNADLEALRDRFVAYVEKAVREAKLGSDWAEQNDKYERSVMTYAAMLFSPQNAEFLEDFGRTMVPFIAAGYINSLSQTLIKLTAPGIPDIYQGTEGIDLSLVDPDNRRPVDYRAFSVDCAGKSPVPAVIRKRKHMLIRDVLAMRSNHPELFHEGEYVPLEVSGVRHNHILAFARLLNGRQTITIAPRLMFGHVDLATVTIPHEFWQDTRVIVPAGMRREMREIFSGRDFARCDIPVAKVLSGQTVALLRPELRKNKRI